MIKNKHTPEQSHSTIKRVLRQTFSNRLSYYNEEQIDAGCSDRASEICKGAESLGIVLGDVSELTKQRDELLAALDSNQSRGVRDVIVERRRQINIEGWSSHHDDQHSYGEMALAAGCYAMFGLCFNAGDPPKYWPWDKKWWKPSDKRRNLVKAAALIIAEIERIDRAAIASVKGGA